MKGSRLRCWIGGSCFSWSWTTTLGSVPTIHSCIGVRWAGWVSCGLLMRSFAGSLLCSASRSRRSAGGSRSQRRFRPRSELDKTHEIVYNVLYVGSTGWRGIIDHRCYAARNWSPFIWPGSGDWRTISSQDCDASNGVSLARAGERLEGASFRTVALRPSTHV